MPADCWQLTADSRQLTDDVWLMTTDCWLLTVDYWLSTDYLWQLTADSWLMTCNRGLLTPLFIHCMTAPQYDMAKMNNTVHSEILLLNCSVWQKKSWIIFAGADGGPHSQVCAPLTLRSAPHPSISFFKQKLKNWSPEDRGSPKVFSLSIFAPLVLFSPLLFSKFWR